jgi:hypothetical protein
MQVQFSFLPSCRVLFSYSQVQYKAESAGPHLL